LKGRRLAIGLPGSGTRLMAIGMLQANGLTEESVAGVHVSGIDGANALLLGAVDCLFVIAAPEAGIVMALNYAPGLSLMSFDRAEAYVRRLPYLTRLLLPEGVIDLRKNVPPRDLDLVTATAELVARDDLHHAIQMLLLMAATEIHAAADCSIAPAISRRSGSSAFPSRPMRDASSAPASRSSSATCRSGSLTWWTARSSRSFPWWRSCSTCSASCIYCTGGASARGSIIGTAS